MKFVDFLNSHKDLMKGVAFDPGMPGFIDVCRAWNSYAIIFPDKCEDVVIIDIGTDPRIGINPHRVDYKKAVESARAKKANVTIDNGEVNGENIEEEKIADKSETESKSKRSTASKKESITSSKQ